MGSNKRARKSHADCIITTIQTFISILTLSRIITLLDNIQNLIDNNKTVLKILFGKPQFFDVVITSSETEVSPCYFLIVIFHDHDSM